MQLEELLGEELYKQVKEKLDAVNEKEPDKLKHIRYADLSEGNYISKAKYDSAVAEKENLEGQIGTLNRTIKTLQQNNKGNEDLQATILKLQTELKKQQGENQKTIQTYALREQLSKSGVTDPDYLIYKHGGIEKFTFDKENHPVGVGDVVKTYKEDAAMAHLFKEESKKPHYNPQNGESTNNKNPFAKETYNMTEQAQLLRSNPEQARALALAAGVTI